MNKNNSRAIIQNAVEVTRPTWSGFDERWDNSEKVFISRAYDQMGFDDWIFVDFLEKHNIYSIEKIGKILDNLEFERKYNRELAGSLESPLYQDMKKGTYGSEGKSFYQSVKEFNGGKGAALLQIVMVYACNMQLSEREL